MSRLLSFETSIYCFKKRETFSFVKYWKQEDYENLLFWTIKKPILNFKTGSFVWDTIYLRVSRKHELRLEYLGRIHFILQ